ncbi:hypothetical protein 13AC503A_gene0025 [Aeromonas phage 13AC503A]|nr:hypothetical protein 13AC503A_gene0025 [Aeromonas phage 13AC503A]
MNHYITINLNQLVSAYTTERHVHQRTIDLQIQTPNWSFSHGLGEDEVGGVSARVVLDARNPDSAPLELGRLLKAALEGVEDIQLTAKPTGAATETLTDYIGHHVTIQMDDEDPRHPSRAAIPAHPVFVVGVMPHIKMVAIWDGVGEAMTLLPLEPQYRITLASEREALAERTRDMIGRGLDFLIDNTPLGGQHE